MPTPWTPASRQFWRAYWTTMRPYLLFVSGVAGMVGTAAAGANAARALAALVPLFLSYGFGQALTDVFQTDTDSLSSPYRPLVRRLIAPGDVLRVSLSGLIACSLILAALSPWSLVPALSAVGGLATYTFFKRRWWGGPWYNGWIVAVLPIIGFMAGGGLTGDAQSAALSSLIPVVASVFFGYANFVLMGYFKDISADSATGYDTIVVRFGWTRAAVASDALAVATMASSAWGVVCHGAGVPVAAVLLLVAGWAVLASAQVGIHRARDEGAAHGPISSVVRGFILVHLSSACRFRPEWLLPSAVFYGLFELVLARRPQKSQV